jgi:anti-anti-sigma factor
MSVTQPALILHTAEESGRITVRFPAKTTLSEANCEELSDKLHSLTENREHLHLRLNLGGVDMLTSMVLAKFLALHTRMRAGGGRLTLFNTTTTVWQIFKVTRLDKVLEVHRSSDVPA